MIPYKLCALNICRSVLSSHPKTNKHLDFPSLASLAARHPTKTYVSPFIWMENCNIDPSAPDVSTGVNFMRLKLRVKLLLAEFLLFLIETFLHVFRQSISFLQVERKNMLNFVSCNWPQVLDGIVFEFFEKILIKVNETYFIYNKFCHLTESNFSQENESENSSYLVFFQKIKR